MIGSINLDAFKGRSSIPQAELRAFLEREMARFSAEVRSLPGPRPPRLDPTKGYRGAHKLFRGGRR